VLQTAGTNAVTYDANQNAKHTGSISSVNTFGFKNRIINGAMVIDQRNAGASATLTNTGYSLDRWQTYLNPASKYTVQQNAGSVTPPVGFTNYLGVTSTSAYSVGAGDYQAIVQPIEGYNVSDLGFGTANAKTVTISFWVRSSLTGTFGGALANNGASRSYPYTYTISAANTWEQKSVTIAGDTAGTWNSTNGPGIVLLFGLGVGTTYSGTAGSWASANYMTATGATSVVGTNGATFYLTGVQLEVGTQATTFDYRSYGTELSFCYRYYYYLGGESPYQNINTVAWYGSGDAVGQFNYPVTMRTSPTISKTGTWSTLGGGGTAGTFLSNDQISSKNVQLGCTGGSGGTSGQASVLRATNDTSLRVTFSAEL
jgi:hypothetical protein